METVDPDGDLRQDFYLYQRPRTRGPDVWYVKFRDPETRKILIARPTRKTNKNQARDWAEGEFTHLAREKSRNPVTFKEFAETFRSKDCGDARRKTNDDGYYSDKVRREKRTLRSRFILADKESFSLRNSKIGKDAFLEKDAGSMKAVIQSMLSLVPSWSS